MDIKFEEVFSKEAIIKRAKENWNDKDKNDKLKASHKYNHIFIKQKVIINDWNDIFDNLAVPQKKLLIKGELIRTYDGLPNTDKTRIKKMLDLSTFSSKWYRLPKTDKNKLLKYVI